MDFVIDDRPIPVQDLQRSRFDEKDSFEELDEVGAGSNGRCVLLKRKCDQALRVCKIAQRIKVRENKYEDKPLEASILLDVLPKHDRILCLYDALVQPRTVQLYYEYYSHGDLYDLIQHHEKNMEFLPETFMWHAYLQLSEALAFLHTGYDQRVCHSVPANWRPVIHGDLKPANIFLSPPNVSSPNPLYREYPSLVIGDFGLATLIELEKPGTLVYQPPEMPASTRKADVWALGSIMHKMAHYEEPIAPFPSDLPDTHDNRMRWYWMPASRVPKPLDELYSLDLHDCVFETFTPDPRGRIDSLSLFKKVQDVFAIKIMPCLEWNLEPLLPMDVEEKFYDENGVTVQASEDTELDFWTPIDFQNNVQKQCFDGSLEEGEIRESPIVWHSASEDWASEDSMMG